MTICVLTRAYYDGDGNVLASYSTYICDDYALEDYTYIYDGSLSTFSYGQHDICAQVSISNAGDTGWRVESNYYCSTITIGPTFENVELWQEGENLEWSVLL